MSTVRVDFAVKPGTDVKAYWIAVGNHDVDLTNGKGSISLQAGREAVLIWWFEGNSGSKLGIIGKVGQRSVVEVKESKIPPGHLEGAGRKRFIP